MTRKTRRILFLVCCSLFLLTAPTVVLYFQGYRVDLNKRRLTQTGGLFIKAIPKQVEVYLDGKLIKKTDFLFGSALIENLLPRKYEILLQKRGYFPWKKNLEIKEKEVTEARNVVLFPENLSFEHLTKEVEDFWFSPDGKKIILKEKSEEGWLLKLYEIDKRLKIHLIKEKDITKKGANLIKLEFEENNKEIVLQIGVGEEIKYFSLSLVKSPSSLVEIEKLNTLPENVLISKKIGDDLYHLDRSGYLYKNEERINDQSFPLQNEEKYSLEIFPNHIFLKEGNTFYLLNRETKSFEKFFKNEKGIKLSPDGKKLAFFSNFEIWVLFLEERLSQPRKKVGEKNLIGRLSQELGDVFWLNSDYLIFNTDNIFRVAEIDDRDQIYILELPLKKILADNLVELKNPKIFWNFFDKKLYVLSEGNVYTIVGILP